MRQVISFGAAILCLLSSDAVAERPNNPVGAHLMIHDCRTPENIEKHTAWARRMTGPWGYIKTFEYNITPSKRKADDSHIHMIHKLYERELIPVVRLGGELKGGQWQKPVDTPDGTYTDIAEAFKDVTASLPRSDKCPLYIEVWNEANLGLEWSGTPDPVAFAKFYVRCTKAIRSINDPRILISPGAMSPGGQYNSLEFIAAMCKAEPDFIHSFDYWATHPYPGATPPEQNVHNSTSPNKFACIDLWTHELDVLKKHGCDVRDLKVLGTETSYRLGHGGDENNPIIDKTRRADYHLRTFRDYWMQWPEVLGMCIWEYAEPFQKETANTWVHADSTTDQTGWPSGATLDYEYVAKLAKPTTDYGCLSGRFIDERTKAGIPGVSVSLNGQAPTMTTDRFGNYILSPIVPTDDPLHVSFSSDSHGNGGFETSVKPGQNHVINKELSAKSTATLRGRVINSATRKVIPGANVRMNPGDFRSQSSAAGVLEFKDIPQGYYDIVVDKHGHYPHHKKETLLTAGQTIDMQFRLGQGTPPEQSLISNGDFERFEEGKGAALGWGGEGDLTRDTDQAFAGDSCQQFSPRSKTVSLTQWTNYSSLDEGKRYRLQGWVRTEGLKGGEDAGAKITATVVTNPHKTLMKLESDKTLRGTEPWTLLTIEFTAPSDAGRVSFQFKVTGDEGTCWLDEAAVIPLD